MAKPCGHDATKREADCRVCSLFATDARYRSLWSGGGPATKRPLPCTHEGAVLEYCKSCSGEQRHVRDCDLHDRCTRVTVGAAVRGCDKCPDYQIDPPPKGGSRLLLSLSFDQDDLREATRRSHAEYAAKIGAEHVILGGSSNQKVAVYEKWRYRPFVAAYERTLILDTDTWVHPDAPSLFDEVPTEKIGVNRVDPWLSPAFDWRRELRELCASQGVAVPDGADSVYWNCGVWVGSKRHADYWSPPPRVDRLPGKWCDEEQWGRRQIFHHGYEVHELDKLWNFQWYLNKDFSRLATTKPWIVHLAGFAAAEKKWRLPMLRLLEAYG